MPGHVERRSGTRVPRKAKAPDIASLLHELAEHQVELNLQNEALRDASVELEGSRSRYRELFEQAPVSYLTLAPDGTILDANRTAQQVLRVPRSELVGQRASRFVASEHVARFTRHRRAVLASGEQLHCDLAVEVDGVRRELRLESVRTRGGQEWRTALMDLTDLHQVQHISRERAFLSTVIDTAGLLLVLDAHGRVVRANEGCQRLLGPEVDVTGACFWEVFATSSTRADVRRRFETFVQSGQGAEWEATVPARGNEGERIVSWHSALLRDARGNVEHVISSGSDLTERRKLEGQLLVADRLSAMGTLAAGIGHEINNPLAYTMLSLARASRLVHDADAGMPSSCRGLEELLATALEGADRIRRIVDDLRSLTSKGRGAEELVDVHAVLDSCARVAENQVRFRARLIRDYRCTRPLEADQTRLSQVFLNLILNAAEAIPDGDPAANTIRIRTRDLGTDRVAIEFEDSGSGIDAQSLSRLFDPFYTTKAHGTGLGLSICYEIITRMGGSITANSVPGDGAQLRIELPAASVHHAQPRLAAAGAGALAASAPIDILIVEDEAQLASSIAALLPEHRVRIASNVRQALEACEHCAFDLILCDVLMPDGSGPDLLDALSRAHPGWQDRIVFMTGGTFTARASDALSRLSNPLLQKPFAVEELLQLVASHSPEPGKSAHH